MSAAVAVRLIAMAVTDVGERGWLALWNLQMAERLHVLQLAIRGRVGLLRQRRYGRPARTMMMICGGRRDPDLWRVFGSGLEKAP